MVSGAWLDGLRRLLAAPALIVGVFVLTLAAAAPLATVIGFAMRGDLGSSLAADEAADDVNYEWWQEFASRGGAASLNSTFTPSILGFATTLDSVSSLLDERPPVPAVALAVAFYLLAWLFVEGGVLDRLARGRRVGSYAFFAACGSFFFRFLRLAAAAALVYWVLFTYVHGWLFDTWYVNATRNLPVERTAFYWRLLMYTIFGALLALTTVVFDYAKVRAVVEDRRSMAGALVAASRFIVRHPGRVLAIAILNAMCVLAVVGLWALAAPGAGARMWLAVAASQGYIAARLIAKLQMLASETALFQHTLAHWGYAAAPDARRPEPPLVRTF